MTDSGAAATAAPPAPEAIPWLGIAAVLFGTFISTLTGRLSSFGLADIRGAVHAGFDDGAWITTAQTTAQMLITPISVWTGYVYGPRIVLLIASSTFAVVSFLIPFSPNLTILLMLMFVSGLASGCFIPLTLSFILRRMPPRLWAYGVALYALNIELSLNISASVEGFWVDYHSWRWIFWQNVPLALAMAACLHFGIRRAPPGPAPPKVDVFGLASSGIGLAMIYAALDQANRLDWFHSGLIVGLMLGGVILLIAFYIHESTVPHAWIDLKAAFAAPMPILLVLIALVRLTILSTSFLIPQFLGSVRGFRALQTGDTLIWIGLPQLLLCPLAGFVLRRADPRINATVGLCCIGTACIMVADGLTPLWGSDQFLPSQLLQALGQSLSLSGIVFAGVLNLRIDRALSFGAMLQVARLMGGEIGTASIATLQRKFEQHASNLLGTHLQVDSSAVLHRLQAYSHVVTRSGRLDDRGLASTSILARVVRSLATTQSVIDGFFFIGFAAFGGLLVLSLLKRPPHGPASPTLPLFRREPQT